MTQQLIEPPSGFTGFELADWLEVTMLLEGIERISQAEVADRFAVGQGPTASDIEEMAAEIAGRAGTAAAMYPFRAEEEEIFIEPTVDPRIYRFLVVLSILSAPYRTEARYNDVGPWFELITREAGKAVFAQGAEGRRFGWPVGDGRPEHLREAVQWLADAMGLETTDVIKKDIDADDNDGGIDVAVWKAFKDGRPSFLVVLIQCTVQETWERKPSDVIPEQWTAWIRFGRPPGVGLAIPFTLPPGSKVSTKARYTTGLLLDRVRICESLNQVDLSGFAQDWAAMATWTEEEIKKIVDALSAPPKAAGTGKKTKKPRMPKRRRPVEATKNDAADRAKPHASDDGE